MRLALLIAALCTSVQARAAKPRVTSIFISEHFINEQLHAHLKPGLIRDLGVSFETDADKIYLRGTVHVPVEELRAVNLDPSLTAYRFQLTIHPEATQEGYLILEFPLNETFFYPATSTNPKRDRVVIPVQMLSVALASVRGYFAALSGDLSAFERKAAKYRALIQSNTRAIAHEKNPDAREELIDEREAAKLQLAAVPIERKQMIALSKEVGGMLRFTGEKELNLNDTFAARQNALIIKLNLASLVPYLSGVTLGGVRLVHDNRDGVAGENYFAVDVDANLDGQNQATLAAEAMDDRGLKIAPSAMIRISQALFESDLVVSAEKKALGSKLRDFKIELKSDGVHVSGKYHKFIFNIPFDTTVDFDTAEADDAFDVSVRKIQVMGMNLDFLSGFILDSIRTRLDQSLRGICTFKDLGENKEGAHVLQVHVNPAQLLPALPGLHLLDVEVRDSEFLLKVGRY